MVDWLIVIREELGPEFYEAMAEILGKTAIIFHSGEDAIRWIETAEAGADTGHHASLALMNVFLDGDRRGTEVGRQLRQSPLMHNIAIVLTDTGRYSADMENEMIREADADRFLYMPLPKFTELRTLFAELVERRQKRVH